MRHCVVGTSHCFDGTQGRGAEKRVVGEEQTKKTLVFAFAEEENVHQGNTSKVALLEGLRLKDLLKLLWFEEKHLAPPPVVPPPMLMDAASRLKLLQSGGGGGSAESTLETRLTLEEDVSKETEKKVLFVNTNFLNRLGVLKTTTTTTTRRTMTSLWVKDAATATGREMKKRYRRFFLLGGLLFLICFLRMQKGGEGSSYERREQRKQRKLNAPGMSMMSAGSYYADASALPPSVERECFVFSFFCLC